MATEEQPRIYDALGISNEIFTNFLGVTQIKHTERGS